MPRIAIIGGGISGLSAAFALERARRNGAAVDYVLYEASPRFGGVLRTERLDGFVLEAGPDSFLTSKTAASDLCRELGLGDQLISSNDAQRKTYILRKGRLVPVPEGLSLMVPTKILPVLRSPLFSVSTKIRFAREWFQRRRNSEDTDESVAAFVERHYGREVVDCLAAPLLSGVYGGDATELSVRAVLPRFVEMEAKYGSLSRGTLAARRQTQPGSAPAPLFTSLKNGMQQLPDALLRQLPAECLRRGTRVDSLAFQNDHWAVSVLGDSQEFDALLLATPAHVSSALLQSASPGLSRELDGIGYASSTIVVLGYDQSVRASLPAGFGFLVPRSEGTHLMAATFVHNKFPHRAPDNTALIRCFFGGKDAEAALNLSDDEISATARTELRQILGIAAEPLLCRVFRWPKAMAQYTVGHLKRIERISALSAQLSRFALAGNAYSGIGIPDCIRSGTTASEQLLSSFR